MGQLLPTLYLHGLAEGDFDLALRGLLGDGAPLSASSVARLKASWQAEYDDWKTRALTDLEPVYLWVDGVYVKAGLEKDKAAMLVILAGLRDGCKIVPAVESGYRESTESWAALLRDLKQRGLRPPRLVVGDGHLGIWSALAAVFPLGLVPGVPTPLARAAGWGIVEPICVRTLRGGTWGGGRDAAKVRRYVCTAYTRLTRSRPRSVPAQPRRALLLP